MRRTTICRSSAVLAAALVAAQPGSLAGQEVAAAPRQAPPAVHVVQQGESLWLLAERFLGDPLLWPEIYRLNTDVIEDPHWIYPGEELRFVPAEPAAEVAAEVVPQQQAVTVTPVGDTARASEPVEEPRTPAGPTVFANRPRGPVLRDAIESRVASAYRAVREFEYYSAGFLTENQPLPTGRIVQNVATQQRGNIRSRSTAQQFEEVVIDLPRGAQVDTGSLLLALRRAEVVPGYGEVIVPTGLLRISMLGTRPRAQVMRPFERVVDGQELLSVAPFRFDNNQRPEPVTDGLLARVIRMRDRTEVANIQDVVFLDKGAGDGVRLGDIFELYIERSDDQGGTIVQRQALVLVVNARERSSSAVIVELFRGDVGAGSWARQVRRMPS